MIRRHHRLRVHVAAQVTPLMILPAHPTASLSVPALASGNQIDDGFCKGFFRSLLGPILLPLNRWTVFEGTMRRSDTPRMRSEYVSDVRSASKYLQLTISPVAMLSH